MPSISAQKAEKLSKGRRFSRNEDDIYRLFERIGAIYGISWRNQYPSSRLVEIACSMWLSGLADKSDMDIEIGLRKCQERKSGFAPNLPEFHALCALTAEDLGLPCVEDAYYLAAKGDLSIPAIYYAVQAIGQYEFRRMPSGAARRMFDQQYKRFCDLVVGGADLSIPSQPLIEQKKQEGPKMSASEAMGALKAMLKGKKNVRKV